MSSVHTPSHSISASIGEHHVLPSVSKRRSRQRAMLQRKKDSRMRGGRNPPDRCNSLDIEKDAQVLILKILAPFNAYIILYIMLQLKSKCFTNSHLFDAAH